MNSLAALEDGAPAAENSSAAGSATMAASSLSTETAVLPSGKNTEPAKQPGGRRKRRSHEEIKGRLLVAGAEEFRRNGYAATTAAIAERADVTEGQLYRYFGSKTELFREAVFKPLNKALSDFCVRYLSQIVAMDDRKERARIYIRNLRVFVNEHPELLTVLTASVARGRDDATDVGALDSLSLYFDTGTIMLESRQYQNPVIKPRLMAKIIFSSVLSVVMFKDWLFPPGSESDDEVVEAIGEFLIAAIHANATGPVSG